MKKGSSLPLLLMIVAFLAIPLGFWFFYSKSNSDNVKGANSMGNGKGVYFNVASNLTTWNLMSYLCKDAEACVASPEAGYQLETVSGGKTSNYQVTLPYQDSWNEYSYLKVYVKSGWGNQSKVFNIVKIGKINDSYVKQNSFDGVSYHMLMIPLKEIKNSLLESATFSD
jgi:hypothetical protein